MNELIERLAREAGCTGVLLTFTKPNGKPDWIASQKTERLPSDAAQLEAFAKAVARECLSIVEKRKDISREGVCQEIREKFGIVKADNESESAANR